MIVGGVFVTPEYYSIVFFSIKVRDEYRQDYDAGRGGYGKLAQNQ
jgi:hypothetical protein